MFDDFAEAASKQVSRAWFFSFTLLVVVLWVPTLFLMKIDTSQLIINTATTIITFWLVALLQNTQDRASKAMTHKLDAIIEAQILLLGDGPECEEVCRKLKEMLGTELEKSA